MKAPPRERSKFATFNRIMSDMQRFNADELDAIIMLAKRVKRAKLIMSTAVFDAQQIALKLPQPIKDPQLEYANKN